MHSGLILQLGNFALPQECISGPVFYFVAALTVIFSLRVVISRNIFHAAIFLAMALLSVACVYLYLDAEFLAIAQILIYVGAIVVLFLFVIMLSASIQDRSLRQVNEQVMVSAISALAFLVIFIKIIKISHWHEGAQTSGVISIAQLGRSLMTSYILPFEVISLILIAVLVGAIIIGKADKT
jgi:NADH-quinone oxidoreductase subunit J